MRLVIDLQGAQGASRLRGIGRYSRDLALAMARDRGRHEMLVALNGALPTDELVLALRDVLPGDHIRIWEGVKGTAAADPGSPPWRAAAELVRAQFLASLRPDIIHVASLFEGSSDDVVSTWPASLERLPIVATCYDLIPLIQRTDYLDGPWRDSSVVPWYFRHLHETSLCDGLLAISESTRLDAIGHLGYRPERIFNISAGVSPHFRPRRLTEAERIALLARYGLRPDFILFVGGGDPRKNEARLIQGFGLLPPDLRSRHQLVIVGKTDPASFSASVAAAGVSRHDVVLIPFVEEQDLPALYSICAVSILPSLYEGFGLPAAEAMACGAPALASDTSSLKEVIGRQDALFDPMRPSEIAARLAAVVTDPALRQSLIEHGSRQAMNFTWERSARRAWDALEQLHAVIPGRKARRGSLKANRRLAFVSPLPPLETGIANYAAELVTPLANHYDITLVCDPPTTTSQIVGHGFPIIDSARFLREAGHFDRVLYQVGNSHLHVTQIERLLPVIPGVVTLHDAFLSGALAWRAHRSGAPSLFSLDLLRSHGWPAAILLAREGYEAALKRYPCSLPVLRAALGVVQHSEHGRSILARHFGQPLAGRSVIIPHLRRGVALQSRQQARRQLGVPDSDFLVCSFGQMALAKLPDRLLEAWSSVQRVDPAARLVFVGEPLLEVSALLSAAIAASARTTPPLATGRVDAEIYRLWLAAADVAVQLRASSRGETSGAVVDCLGAGLPVVVNAHGAKAELPDDIAVKLPEDVTAAALSTVLLDLRADPARRYTLGKAAKRHVVEELDPGRVAIRYRDAIEAAYEDGPVAWRHAVAHAASSVLVRDEAGLAAVARSIVHSFPTPHPTQLLFDCTGLESPPETARAVLRGCLADHPDDIRVHLVRWRDGVFRQDWASAAALLDLPPLVTPPDTVDAGPGDVLVSLGAPVEPAAAATLRRRGVVILDASGSGAALLADDHRTGCRGVIQSLLAHGGSH